MGLLLSIDVRMERIACLLYYLVIKMELLAQAILAKESHMADSSKNVPKKITYMADYSKSIQKRSKCFNKNIRRVDYYIVFQINTHSFLSPPTHFFEGGESKFSKNWVRGAVFKKTVGKTKKVSADEMQKSYGNWVFLFLFPTINYDGN